MASKRYDSEASTANFIEALHDSNLNIDDLVCPVCDQFVPTSGCPDHPLQKGLFDGLVSE